VGELCKAVGTCEIRLLIQEGSSAFQDTRTSEHQIEEIELAQGGKDQSK
jgi:hypothetical protein